MPRSRWIGPLASFRRAAIPAAVAVTAAAVIAPVSAAVVCRS